MQSAERAAFAYISSVKNNYETSLLNMHKCMG